MDITAVATGGEYSRTSESDVVRLHFDLRDLKIILHTAAADGSDAAVEYRFRRPHGFRWLDDGDLVRYWESGAFPRGHHLFEITSGGWRAQEMQLRGMLSVTDSIGTREFFVCTTNGCVNVLSASEPQVAEVVGEEAFEHGA